MLVLNLLKHLVGTLTIRPTGSPHPIVNLQLCLLRVGIVTIVLELQSTSIQPVIYMGILLLASGRAMARLALTLTPLVPVRLVLVIEFPPYSVPNRVTVLLRLVVHRVNGRLVVIVIQAMFTKALGCAANILRAPALLVSLQGKRILTFVS